MTLGILQETSQVVYKAIKAHSSALYKVKPLTFNLIATGDEDGTVKLWDNRVKTGFVLQFNGF